MNAITAMQTIGWVAVLSLVPACTPGGTPRMLRADVGVGDAGQAVDVPARVDAARPMEACDGLDDDSDGRVDEDCNCTPGATQDCFPAWSMPDSCEAGTQTCSVVDGRAEWSECTGALLPLSGQTECCPALGPRPRHIVLEAFLAAYPFSRIPSHHSMMPAFLPDTGTYRMTSARLVVGGEIVDRDDGGVTIAKLHRGREVARAAAIADLAIVATSIHSMLEPEPEMNVSGSGCSHWGAAWGSILYRTGDGGLAEVVYLYVGMCNDGDAEGYYRSDTPFEACTEGVPPLM